MKNIVILATGGTIAGVSSSITDTANYQPAILPIEAITKDLTEPLRNIAHISSEQIAQIDSAEMTHEIWFTLAGRINALLSSPQIDGVVVTHGTDTLEETAYFLNLVVRSNKPVVVVGAMRPASALSSDGPMNLYNAIILAASREASGKGVLVTLNNSINSSREVTKTNTSLQDSFKAPELGYLGYLIEGEPHFYREPTRKHTYRSEFILDGLSGLPPVEIIYGHVGNLSNLAQAAVDSGVKGLVYAGLGNGNMSKMMKETFMGIQAQGVVVVRSTRVSSGIVTCNGAVNDDLSNFIVSDTLNPQKSSILLALALSKTTDIPTIQRMFWEY
ncbi:MAG TPA: L-asparaginase 2 [Firmicutes bacterium]|jgi:L-asparaginase|nr:L-asparaginase 2 [Bacillota bacterium]